MVKYFFAYLCFLICPCQKICGERQELKVSVPVFVSLCFAHPVLSPDQLSAFEALSPPLEALQAIMAWQNIQQIS